MIYKTREHNIMKNSSVFTIYLSSIRMNYFNLCDKETFTLNNLNFHVEAPLRSLMSENLKKIDSK